MRGGIVLTYGILLCCVIHVACYNVRELITSMTADIGNAFNIAWTRITAAIKSPVRIKRLGRGGRRKRTTPLTSPVTPAPGVSTIAIYLFSRPQLYPGMVRPTIPVIPSPQFKSLVEWRRQQIPYVFRQIRDDFDFTD